MQIFPLSEGEFTIGHDKIFVPFDSSTDILTDRPTGSLLVEVQPFLVEMGSELLMLDTGLGFNNTNGSLQIHANLAARGYRPGDVTKVLMSHLHKDHAGGLVYKDESGLVRTTFPNAEYCIYRPEADFALATGFPSYQPEEIEPLLASGQVRWLDGTGGNVAGGIRYWHTGGHSQQHIVFLLEEDGQKVFFGGDEAPQLKQLKIKYVAKYDFDGKRAMQLREAWSEQGRNEGWTFLFYHDIAQAVATV